MIRRDHQELMNARVLRHVHKLIETYRLTDPQLRFLRSTASMALLTGANQIGKSIILAIDALLFLRGEHPYDQTHKPPVRMIIAGESWTEMVPLIRSLWSMMDKRDFSDSLRFEGGQIKGQKETVFDVVSGPGKGSSLILATFRQGANRIKGETVHRFSSDEPLPEPFYGEAVPRLLRYGGHLRMGFTPTLDTAPKLDWFWEKVDEGIIEEHRAELCLDSVTPRGGLLEVPWMDQEAIDDFESKCLPIERETRMGRSRDLVVKDRILEGYSLANDSDELPPVGADLGIGIDHGSKAGRQSAVIVAVQDRKVWVLDCIVSEGRTTPQEDAAAIIASLANLGYRLASVDHWVGDRPHPGDRRGGRRSNDMLKEGFAAELRCELRDLPQPLRAMTTPYKYTDSVWAGCRLLNWLMLNDELLIHSRCDKLKDAFKTWNGKREAPEKDRVDSARYIIAELVDNQFVKRKVKRNNQR